MADIAELGFKADTKGVVKATKDLDKLEQQSSSTERGVGKLERSFARADKEVMALGAATAGLVAGLSGMAAVSASANRELINQAKLAGVGVAEFQRLSIAARGAGIEQDKFADIAKDAQEKIGDFIASGAGPLAGFFDDIGPKVGVTIDQFKELSGPAALGLLVSSLEKANLTQAETIFYMEEAASDATLLLDVFKDGGAVIEATEKRMKALGVSLNEVDVRRVAGLSESFGLLSTSASNATTKIVSAFSDELNDALESTIRGVNYLAEVISDNSEEIKTTVQVIGASVAAYATLRAATLTYTAVTRGATTAQTALNLAMRANPALILATAIGALGVAVYSLTQRTEDAATELDKVTAKAEAYKAKVKEVGTVENQQRADSIRADIARLESSEQINKALETRARIFETIKRLEDAGQGDSQAVSVLRAQAEKLSDTIAEQGKKAAQTKTQVAALKEELKQLTNVGATTATEPATEKSTGSNKDDKKDLEKAKAVVQSYIDQRDALILTNAELARKKVLTAGGTEAQAKQVENLQAEIELIGEKSRAEEHAASVVDRRLMSVMSAEEQQRHAHAETMAQLEADRDADLISHQQYLDAKKAQDEDHADRMRKLNMQTNQKNLGLVAGTFGNMAQIAAAGGEKQFENYKALASAQASISAALAIMSVLGDPAIPVFLKGAAATAMAGVAAVQVAKIQGQQYQGSYLGGGYTGDGTRSGGIDGKGGFPAILHPNETVIDHERGGGMGGTVVNVTPVFNMQGGGDSVREEIMAALPMITQAAVSAVERAVGRGGSMSRAVGRR